MDAQTIANLTLISSLVVMTFVIMIISCLSYFRPRQSPAVTVVCFSAQRLMQVMCPRRACAESETGSQAGETHHGLVDRQATRDAVQQILTGYDTIAGRSLLSTRDFLPQRQEQATQALRPIRTPTGLELQNRGSADRVPPLSPGEHIFGGTFEQVAHERGQFED